MIFEGTEYMQPIEDLNDVKEEDYDFLVHDILKYIERIKCREDTKDISIIEVIMDYTFKNNLDISTVGDAISSDEHFKSFIEKDCRFRNSSGSVDTIGEW
jgi:hypothetical protein